MASAARTLTREERDLNAGSDGAEYWARVARERRIAHLQPIVARRLVANPDRLPDSRAG
jgi:hypothetical protein